VGDVAGQAVLLALEEVERDRFGIVSVQELLAFVLEVAGRVSFPG